MVGDRQLSTWSLWRLDGAISSVRASVRRLVRSLHSHDGGDVGTSQFHGRVTSLSLSRKTCWQIFWNCNTELKRTTASNGKGLGSPDPVMDAVWRLRRGVAWCSLRFKVSSQDRGQQRFAEQIAGLSCGGAQVRCIIEVIAVPAIIASWPPWQLTREVLLVIVGVSGLSCGAVLRRD